MEQMAELKRRLEEIGFFRQRTTYYTFKATFFVLLFACGYGTLLSAEAGVMRIIAILLLASLLVQLGFMAHDAGHYAVAENRALNDFFGFLGFTILSGISFTYWRANHNRHHAAPNDQLADPDMQSDLASLYEASARRKTGWAKIFTRYQSVLVFLAYGLHPYQLRTDGAIYILKNPRKTLVDLFCLALHLTIWFVVPACVTSIGNAIFYYAIIASLSGYIYGPIFIATHNGMPILQRADTLSFLERQTITTRNISAPPFLDFYFGGLHFHIEHHLFPHVSPANYRQASPVVQAFLREHNLPYRSDGFLHALAHVYAFLDEMAAVVDRS